jgi:hypothetical protein
VAVVGEDWGESRSEIEARSSRFDLCFLEKRPARRGIEQLFPRERDDGKENRRFVYPCCAILHVISLLSTGIHLADR